MALKVDYYTSLLRAVDGLDWHAYAARGAVYEREHKALLRLLFSADPPRSEIEIEREQQAFRDAIRRVEFGDEGHRVPLVPQRASAQERMATATMVAPVRVAPAPLPPPAPAVRPRLTPASLAPENVIPAPAPPTSPRLHEPEHFEEPVEEPEPVEQEIPEEFTPAPPVTVEPEGLRPPEPLVNDTVVDTPKRTPLVGMLLRRTALATVLLGLGAIAYGRGAGDFDVSWISSLFGDGSQLGLASDPNAQQAIIFDDNLGDPDQSKAAGKAVWRMNSKTSGADGSAPVLQIDLEIPQRRLILSMSITREASGSPLSHLIELRFLAPDRSPDNDIVNIGGVYMTTEEAQRRGALAGRVMRVSPGVFLFGLANQDAERQQNLRYLKDMAWLNIPLMYRNGAFGVLAVEKGAVGSRVIEDVLAKWGQ